MSQNRDFNQKQYSQNFQQYLDSNVEGNIGGGTPQDRIELLKKYLPDGRTVFEIGSGGGIDATLLKEAGYNLMASDYVEKFVDILKEKELHAVSFDAKNDELSFPVDCIYANAVFVHFSPEEISNFLSRVKDKLTNEKLIFLTIIKGEGQERSVRNRGFERDFYYYSAESLKKLIEKVGYKMLYLKDEDSKWIQAIITYPKK